MTNRTCMSDEQMRLAGTPFESFLMRFVFPVLFLLGTFGNLINLRILRHPKMRSRSSTFLAALAVADLAFLISMLPHSLASYDYFAFDNTFRILYFYTKKHLVAFANWFSASSIWIIVAICVDRLLRARTRVFLFIYNQRYISTSVLLGSIAVGTFLLTLYNHVAYDCYEYRYCNGSQVYSVCVSVTSRLWRKDDVTPHSQLFRSLIHIATVLHAVLVVLIPNILISILNCALIYELKRTDENLFLVEENAATITRQKKERRAILTVCAIVTCFTLTQGPSAWLQLWLMTKRSMRLFGTLNYNLNVAASCLVYTGKSLNFLLFCLSSKPYRKRLGELFKDNVRGKFAQRQITQRQEHNEAKTNFEMVSLTSK